MKKLIIVALAFLVCISCEKNNQSKTASNKILPLGASRVQGDPPNYHSYRYKLWKKLVENGWSVDFVGSQIDPKSYALVDNEEFDPNHEGHIGYTSGQILEELDDWMATVDTPNIVLFSSPGGNDALDFLPYEDAVDNIVAIVQKLQVYNPNVTVVIEEMAPGNAIAMLVLGDYFTRIQNDMDSLVDYLNTPTSNVVSIDMATGFDDDLLADPVHYNQQGASFISARYYDLLISLMQP
jgi:lysophospholipase L1-like esterase